MTDFIKKIRQILLADTSLCQKMKRIELSDGQILFQRGNRDSAFYLIQSGQIRIYTCDECDRQNVLQTLNAETILGEIETIENRYHNVEAISVGSSVVLRLNRDDFWQRVDTSTELSFWVIQLLSQRIDCLFTYIAELRDGVHQIIAGEYDLAAERLETIDSNSDGSINSLSLLLAATESLKEMIQMVRQIKQSQSQPVKKLKVKIDRDRYQQQVEEIVSTDYFDYLVELSEQRNTVADTQNYRADKSKVLPLGKLETNHNSDVNSLQNAEIQEALAKGLKIRSEAFNRLILKAWTDEEFKQKFLNNPRIAYAEEFGYQVPNNLTFKVVEETLNAIEIVLPASPLAELSEAELSEETLNAIAAGNLQIGSDFN